MEHIMREHEHILLVEGERFSGPTEKNGFVTATKLGTTNKIFVAATKRFVERTKHFVVVTNYFCYPYFNK